MRGNAGPALSWPRVLVMCAGDCLGVKIKNKIAEASIYYCLISIMGFFDPRQKGTTPATRLLSTKSPFTYRRILVDMLLVSFACSQSLRQMMERLLEEVLLEW